MSCPGLPAAGSVRHLYVHLPFCAHRCGYCDFVTVVGRASEQQAYVDALLAELEAERRVLAPRLDTVYLGGGTPTFTRPGELARALRGLPTADEVTVEANPETVTGALAAELRMLGVTRVSLGAQSFQPQLLDVLERHAGPEQVRRAVSALRAAGFDNVSLDLVYGIPGQTEADLDADLDAALALEPEHVSAYELEPKPGTRFTLRFGDELGRQASAMEGYFERVVGTLELAGYRWYETASFCLAGSRDLRARHDLAYWRGRDYLGLGIGAVSTLGRERRRNRPGLAAYVRALGRGEHPPREHEALPQRTRLRELLMLGLRLDEPVALAAVASELDAEALERMCSLGLVEADTGVLRLTRRGRFLGGGVTAELLTEQERDEPRRALPLAEATLRG